MPIPRHATPLRGRSEDLAVLDRTLNDPSVSSVTLTGLAGVGKTRIAAEAARAIETSGRAQVAWVDYDRLSSPDLLEPTIASAAGLTSWDPADSTGLAAALDATPRIVVVDGFDPAPDELPAVAALARLLDACHTTHFVLTARTSQRPSGAERVVRVDPLAVTAADAAHGRPGHPNVSPAVQVFLDVAETVGAPPPTGDDHQHLAAIAALLGGLPLALELTGARARTFSPSTLRALLERPTPNGVFASSVFGRDGGLARSLEWSIEQLDEDQRALVRALTAFHGAVPIGAIEAIHPGDGAVDLLSQLVDAHLVEAEHDRPATTFTLPPVVREYLASTLSPAARAALERRHRRWAVATARAEAEAGRGETRGPSDTVAVVETDLLAALHHALADEHNAGAGAADAGDLLVALAPRWLGSLTHEEHLALAHRTAAALERHDGDDVRLALACGWHALLLAERASNPTALEAVDLARTRTVELANRLEPLVRLRVLALLVRTARVDVDRSAMGRLCDEGLVLARDLGEEAILARFEIWAGMLAHQLGDFPEAVRLGAAALDRGRHLDDEALTVMATGFLRTLPSAEVDDLVLPSAADVVEAARRCGEDRVMLWMLPWASVDAFESGRISEAIGYDLELLRRSRDAGIWATTAIPMLNLATVAEGRWEPALLARVQGMVGNHLHILGAMMRPERLARWRAQCDATRNALGHEAYEATAAAGAVVMPGVAATEVLEKARVLLSEMSVADPPPHLPRPDDPGNDREVSPLTAREREVIGLLVEGDSNKDIADRLGITPKTVMHHTSSIYRKLGVRGRAEAVAWAVRRTAA